ncbi:hypothetical protein CCR75_001745 [Bremia lactucae]|uniref:Uncharacterized protein n=1 Tax=Bremia lactucae TaxID=4779 RepID=A0A976FRD3_BRELC|nr:hypothetical protein CCR75_001745 [Bremia lactucae]
MTHLQADALSLDVEIRKKDHRMGRRACVAVPCEVPQHMAHVGASHIAGPMRHEEEWQPQARFCSMTKKKRIELQKHDNIPMPRGIACQRFGVKKNGLKSRQAIFLFFVNRIIDGSVCCCNTLAIANRCGSWHCGSLSPQKRCYCRGEFDVEMKLPRKKNVVNQVTSALLAHFKKAVFPILAQVQN